MVADINITDIIRYEFIGQGSYGRVYKGTWKKITVAIKDVESRQESRDGTQSIIVEAKQLSRATHPNIIRILGTCSWTNSSFLVMEFADCGSLHETLHGKQTVYKYTYAHSLSWARQCAEGIAHLHGMRPKPIIHRDIKPANLLLFDERTTLKIGDFGTVRDKSSEMTMDRGSAPWMAPEVSGTAKYNEKCDVYSWAIVLWEILARDHPFKEYDNHYAIIFNVHKGQRPPLDLAIITKPVNALLVRCWDHEAENRLAMEYVVEEMKVLCVRFSGEKEPIKASSEIRSLPNSLGADASDGLEPEASEAVNDVVVAQRSMSVTLDNDRLEGSSEI